VAHIMKVLMDDHARIRRMFAGFRAQPTNPDLALGIVDELKVHSAMEEELVYPVLREANAALAKASEADHAAADKLMGRVEKMEPGSRDLYNLMVAIEDAVEAHIEMEEAEVIPVLTQRLGEQAEDLGREAFGFRQELIAELPARTMTSVTGLPNSGWGKGYIPNAGW
jgi:hemerythrin-like domain-containing protein